MYKTGGFDFPTVTGNFSVTGLGFEPVGVIMFGSNRPEVDTLVTGLTGPGLFISVNAKQYDSPFTAIRSLCLAINGNSDANNANYRGFENGPISMQADGGDASVVDYRADSITFDSDGFSINVATAASARRPIHWLAFGGDFSLNDATAMVAGAVKQGYVGDVAYSNSYEPRSALVVGTIATAGFGEGSVNGSTWFSFGTGHYPEASPDPNSWQSSTVYTEIQLSSSLGRQGFSYEYVWPSVGADPESLNISNTIGALGPVLNESYRRLRPNYGVDMTEMINEGTVGSDTWQYGLWWNGEGWTDFVSVPNDGSVTVPAPFNFSQFQAVMFSHINGASSSGGLTAMRFGFGVLGPTYQGCVVIGQDGSFYQSDSRAVASCSASGENTASGTINGSTFSLVNEEGGGMDQFVYHAFGASGVTFLPQIYRRW